MYFLYIVSCPAYADQDICKIGCTSDPHSRLQHYFTSYPPGMAPYDIHYYGIWEIDADDDQDMKYKEGIIHDEFYSARKKRDISSEWFEMKIENVAAFIESCDFTKRRVILDKLPRKKRSLLETISYPKNRKLFVRDEIKKNEKLDQIQAPVIQRIQQFLESEEVSGQLIAPCGSGKTNMTCKAIQHLKKIIICVPSVRIQEQWDKTIGKECVFVGGDSDDWTTICNALKSDEFCILTTYASCKKLVDELPALDLIVFDEAHHMVGLVSDDKEKGTGITRVLLKTVVDRNLKRLFLTFTPKDVETEDDATIMSMNDPNIFGHVLYEIKLRSLIQQGVLPDYNIWALSSEGIGTLAKVEQLILAWNSEQIHHTIVFVENLTEKEEVKRILQERTNSLVLSIENSKDSTKVIEKYTNAKRAILVDCKRLGEGVDIPVADSVAILYGKESIVEIVQMVLRAGRWYKHKSVFHILLPHTVDDDMSGIQSVLYCLAKFDEALRGELLLTNPSAAKGDGDTVLDLGISNEHIQYEILNSLDYERMKECFGNIRNKLTKTRTKKESYEAVQQINKLYEFKSKISYFESKSVHPKFIDDPKVYFRDRWSCWYEFLGVDISQYPKTKHEWIQTCKEKKIQTWEEYKLKKDNTLPENPSEMYEDYTNWNQEFQIHEEIVW